jgi:hypothetical protein
LKLEAAWCHKNPIGNTFNLKKIVMRSAWVSLVFFGMSLHAPAQSFTWWAQNVHWDGVTPWERYIKFSPGFLGPNALPGPQITNGSIDSVNSAGIGGSFYFSRGDQTENLSLYANYCLVKNKISFDFFWVPIEHFVMSRRLKEERNVFSDFYYEHYASGDMNLNTNIQLVNNEKKMIYSSLRIGYRFANSEIGAARFTDAPGYYFDMSFAKKFVHAPAWKWIAMAGIYVWQSDDIKNRHRQDDAFLFGSGFEWNKKNLRIQTYIAGYLGYNYHSRDKPYVFRLGINKRIKRNTCFFQLQQGLHNFNYSSAEAGIRFNFK